MKGVPRLYGWRWPLSAALSTALLSLLGGRLLRLSPPAFAGVYGLAVTVLGVAFVVLPGLGPREQLVRRWRSGSVAGAVLGFWLSRGALSEIASPVLNWGAVGAVMVYGMWYGAAEAMAVSLIPVLSLYGALPAEVLRDPGRRLRHGGLALLASAVIALAGRVGFPFAGAADVVAALSGNAMLTLGYLLTGSPLAPLLGHVIGHLVWALGRAQLPPPF